MDMKKYLFVISAILLLALSILGGCATLGDVVRLKPEGMSRVYPVTVDQAWEITEVVLRWVGAEAVEEHRSEGYALTGTGVNTITAGALIGVWIDPVDKGHTRVTVVTKRRFIVDPATGLREGTFHQRFAAAVEILKAGKPLPIKHGAEC
jgi:hypothetical protein